MNPLVDPDADSPGLQPPPPSRRELDPRTRGLRKLALGGFVLLAAILLGVVFLLPAMVAKRDDGRPAPASPAAARPPPSPPARQADSESKREAEQALGAVLRRQAELEAAGIAIWGGDDYRAVLAELAQADALYAQHRHGAAARAYGDVKAALDVLDDSKPARLAAALDALGLALENGQADEARRQSDVALAIDPENERARRARARAQTIQEVMGLHAEGLTLESQGDLDGAQARYRKANELDADFEPARSALAFVTEQIAERDFRAAMTATLSALEASDLKAARSALNRAAKLKSAAPEVRDARVLLARAVQQDALGRHRARAEKLAGAERWAAAADAYAKALAVDPNARFAREGRARSLTRAGLFERMDAYIRAPQRLASDEPMTNARRLLDEARAVPDAGPRLATRVETLEGLLAAASTPVAVRLSSDNNTAVVLYRIGALGRFERRELDLRPGRYTAVGTRPGYRDVRLVFEVKAGGAAGPFDIRCRERI